MPNKGYDDTIGGWEKLLEAVKSHERDLPGAESLRAALELHLQEAKEAKSRQELHRAGRQRATKDLGRSMTAGRETFSRLSSLVKSVFGPRDQRLPQFGMAPIEPSVRKPRQPRKPQPSAGFISPEPAT